MRRIFRVFMSVPGWSKWTILAGLVLATVAEGFGLASLLPALTVLLGEGSEEPTVLHELVYGFLAAVGLPAGLESLLLLVLLGVFAKAALIALAMIRLGYAVAEVATDLRTTLLQHLLKVKWAYFTREALGRFANAMSQDATRAGRAYMLAQMFVASLLETTMSITLAFLVSWRLAMLGLAVGGVILLILRPFVRLSKKAGRGQQRGTQGFVTLLTDTLIGIKPLKAMSRQEHFLPLFKRETRILRRALRWETTSESLMNEMREPIFMAFAVVGIYLAQARFTVSMSELIVMAMLLYRTVSSLGRVQRQLQRAVTLEASHRAVHKMIREAASQREEFVGTKVPTLDQACVFDRVSFAFGTKPVLDEVSLTIPANRLTVLMGPSGVGKTTIADLLLGLFEPHAGRILIDGVPLPEIDLRAWRGMVGYVPQELTLFHDSVLANLTLGDPAISAEQARVALDTAGAGAFVASLPEGLLTTVGERGMQLSGGQRQRIALARALLIKPRLLILDEVTSALDPATEAEICTKVRTLDGAMTILAITHRPAWVDVADRVYEVAPNNVRLARDMGREPAPLASSGIC
jgi:ATP-binding cassette, subfamily C, bacterial